jgi:hypothetical protein
LSLSPLRVFFASFASGIQLGRHMIWQTTRFAIDLAAPGDGHRQRHARFIFRRRRACRHRLCAAPLRAPAGRGRRHAGHRGRIHPPRQPAVPLAEELARVLPVLRGALQLGVPVSVDTYKPEVMRAALDLGADIVNDIWALRQPGAAAVVARHPSCGVCLMHMHGDPATMQNAPMTGDAVPQVLHLSRAARAGPASAGGRKAPHRAGPRHWLWQDRGAELQPAGAPARTAGGRLAAAGRLVAQVITGRRPCRGRAGPAAAR